MASASPLPVKQRELVFSANPRGQVERGLRLLSGLRGLRVERGTRPQSLWVTYSLLDYTLESLESALVREGLQLDDGALGRFARQLTHYLERVEAHNLRVPEWHAQNRKSEAFINVYAHHLHGDHDDTPPELREYR